MRAAWSPNSTVHTNNYGLVKLFLSRWRLAEPLPLVACLVHLAAPAAKGHQEARLAERQHAFGMRLFAAGEPLHSVQQLPVRSLIVSWGFLPAGIA